jgi:PAS domain S-box-containing protein
MPDHEQRFSLISRITNDAVWDWDLETNELWWSEGLERTFGFDLSLVQPSAKWWEERIHPEDRERVLGSLRDFLASEATEFRSEYRFQLPDGGYARVADLAVALRDAMGKPRRMLGGLRDVTEAQATEAALQRSEGEFRAIFDLAAGGVALADLEGRLTRANRKYCEMLGYTEAELFGKTVMELTHPADRGANQANFQRVLEGEAEDFIMEKRYLRKDGSILWVEVAVSCLRDAQGQPTHWLASVVDISERKQSALQLEQNEARLRRVLDNLFAFVGVLELDGTVRECNRAPLEAAGLKLSDVRGKLLWDCSWFTFSAEVQAKARDACLRAARGEVVEDDIVMMMLGGPAIVHFQIAPLRNESGEITHLIPSAVDISKRLEAEDSLRQAHQRLSLAQGAGRLGIFDWLIPEGRTVWSPELEDLYGIPRGSFNGTVSAWLAMVDPEDAPSVAEDLQQAVENRRESLAYEFRAVMPDGSRRWFAGKGQFFFGPDGVPLRMVGINIDIDDRKRAEDMLEKERQLLSGIIEGTDDVIAAIDTDCRLLAFNEAFRRVFHTLFGVDVKPGISVVEAIAHLPEDQQTSASFWRRALAGERFTIVERFGDPQRGTRKWFELSFSPILDTEGRLIGAAHIVRDNTHRLEAEEALRSAKNAAERSRAEQQAIVNSMAEGLAIFDPEGNLIDMNPAAVAIHGFESLDMLRRHLTGFGQLVELHDLEGQPIPLESWPISRALRGETFKDYELRVEAIGQGRSFVASYSGGAVRNADGRIILALATLRDITSQREAEQALTEAKGQLEEHAKSLEQTIADRTAQLTETIHELEAFSYSLSHDMRAPLRAMKGFSEILQAEHGERMGESGMFYLGKISSAAGRLDQLIRDVLAYSQIVQSSVKLGPVSLDQLIRQLIDENPTLQPPLATVCLASPLLPVLGHEAYLTQALSNLLYNAVKFVRPGDHPTVGIWTARTGDWITLYIQDHGIGIPAEARSRLFGLFERLHGKEYEGTGIGLSIVRKAVERMGGMIGFDSVEHEGSTFWIRLKSPASSPPSNQ